MPEPAEVEIDDDTLVSQMGIADYFEVSRKVVNNWVTRQPTNGFPDAEPQLYVVGNKHGNRPTRVWQLTKVIQWRDTYRPKFGAATHGNRSRSPWRSPAN